MERLKLRNWLSMAMVFIYLRGFKVWISYKTQVALTVLSWTLPVFTYYFVGTSLGQHVVSAVGVHDYTQFFVIGLAFQGYMSSVIATISQRLRNEQLYGTIEYYVISKAGVTGFLTYSALWGFLLNTINAVVILSVGYALGVRYDVNFVSTGLVLITLIASTFGLASLSGAFTMIIKQGNPVSFFFSTFTTLMSGTVFPVAVLPLALRYVSYALPLTWALNGLRDSMLMGASISSIWNIMAALLIFDVILVPLGIFSFRMAFRHARKKGTLAEY